MKKKYSRNINIFVTHMLILKSSLSAGFPTKKCDFSDDLKLLIASEFTLGISMTPCRSFINNIANINTAKKMLHIICTNKISTNVV